MIPKQIRELIKVFSSFPTIGERTATRFVLYLLSQKKENLDELCSSIAALEKEIKRCGFCFNPFAASQNQTLCEICRDKKRDKTICVVEKESDLWQMEKIKKYQGKYFILGGKIDFLKENPLGKLRVEELKKRIQESKPKEVILALNPTVDGNLTMDYIKRILKPYHSKITKLAQGLPLGGEIEYADEETLGSAFEGRK
jgi:recombination protein RecR